jgi:hypothetical protein
MAQATTMSPSILDGLLRTRADARLEGLRNARLSWWSHWAELAQYFLPRRYTWLVQPNQANRGSPINAKIIDETGTIAWRALASGLMAGITSPGRPWFRLSVDDAALGDLSPVKLWLDQVTKVLQRIMAKSNYYSGKATQFGDVSMWGTAPMLIEEDDNDIIRCYTPCAGEHFVAHSARQIVDTFAREFVMTLDQLRKRFPDTLPEKIANLAKSASALSQEFVVCHLIETNDDELGSVRGWLVPSKFPIRSLMWIKGEGQNFLEKSGYHEWPAPTARWDLSGNDAYGRAPSMDALGSQKELYVLTVRKAQAIDKTVNPPLIADIMLKGEKTSSLPGGITYVAGLGSTPGMKSVYDMNFSVAEIKADIVDVRRRIESVFFKDLFLMISNLDTVRSATEIDARREEKLIQLGPMMERFETESLGPDIDRIFAIGMRKRIFPPAPRELHGVPLKIDYTSVLSQQQKAASTAAIERLLQVVGNIGAAHPEIADKVDFDAAIDIYADALGVPPQIVRDTVAVMKIRDQKAKQAQQAQMMAMTPQMVQGAKVLSQTELGGGGNALAAMMGQGGQPEQMAQAA